MASSHRDMASPYPDSIPLGSWDTHQPVQLAKGLVPNLDSFQPKLFSDSESTDLHDRRMAQALVMLDRANILRYHQLHILDAEQHLHDRFLIYGIHQSTYNTISTAPRRFVGKRSSRKLQDKVYTRRALAMVLLNMNIDPSVFYNQTLATPLDYSPSTVFQGDMDKRLIDVYMEMPSPRAVDDPLMGLHIRSPSKSAERLLRHAVERDAPKGMRTKLYQYQKNSLWKLLRRELCPDSILDPSFIPMQDMDGKSYYLNLTNEELTICRTPPVVWDDVLGGIICEDMFSRPPAFDTQLYSNIYPYTPSTTVVIQDGFDSVGIPEMVLTAGSDIPSLRDLAAASVKMHGVEYRRFHDYINPTTMELLEDASVYYYVDDNAGRNRASRSKQSSTTDQSPEVYLSSATLVIVPANLIAQWSNEVNKHTEDFALRMLIISSETDRDIPDYRTLMKQDMVLISLTRFAKEYVPGAYSQRRPKEKPPCRCKELYITCRCPPARSVSPLMQVRWKRVIVDEGHSLGMKLSDHSLLAEKLHADRRWICTGTPTFNLANLQSSSSALNAQISLSDKGDLDRLSALFGSFLHLQPYYYDKDLFSKVIQKPLVDHHNIRAGISGGDWSLESLSSVARLRYLMDRVMVRNKAMDVERDVALPPLYERIVRLDLEYFQVLAINCQIALIQANAVLTERVDQDYFFHPSNRKHLARVVENLKDGCFWYPGGDDYKNQLRSALKHVRKGIQKHEETEDGKYSEQDTRLLEEICEHIERALRDRSWNTIQGTQEVGYYCTNLPRIVQGKYALIPSSELGSIAEVADGERGDSDISSEAPAGVTSSASGSTSIRSNEPTLRMFGMSPLNEEEQVCVMLAKQITHLRNDVTNQERTMEETEGSAQRSCSPSQNEGCDMDALPNTTYIPSSSNSQHDHILAQAAFYPAENKLLLQEKRLTEEAMLRDRLSRSWIMSSTSSKLNYVISQILRHHRSEKCIVFCQSRTAIYYIHEYLTLAKVRCLMYHTQGMTENERSNNIMTFNTSENVSTIIMDTKHAAFGIDLSSASRVYFISPVWQTATMRQAVKRAHRIGQIRPVYVETLVIRNSFEEAMLNRRLEIDNEQRSQVSSPLRVPTRPDVVKKDKRKGKERSFGYGDDDAFSRPLITKSKASRDMVDDRKMRDLISHIEFMPLPTWAVNKSESPFAPPLAVSSASSASTSDTSESMMPELTNGLSITGSSHHLYMTLADYAVFQDGTQGAQDASVNSYQIPVVFPFKETTLAVQQQRLALESQDVAAVDHHRQDTISQQNAYQGDDDDQVQDPPQEAQSRTRWSFWQDAPESVLSTDEPYGDSSMEMDPSEAGEYEDNNHNDPLLLEQQQGEEMTLRRRQMLMDGSESLPTTELNSMNLTEAPRETMLKPEQANRPETKEDEIKLEMKNETMVKVESMDHIMEDVKFEGDLKIESRLKTEPVFSLSNIFALNDIKGEQRDLDACLEPKTEPEHYTLFDDDDDDQDQHQEQDQDFGDVELKREATMKVEERSCLTSVKDERGCSLAVMKRSPGGPGGREDSVVKRELTAVKRVRFG
ncbi:hypothetical protein BGX28_003130 [Mortierella sp. GBA30]|nr:hypothetical protein BGX28_003130 [Mortierella sp. GBA30]